MNTAIHTLDAPASARFVTPRHIIERDLYTISSIGYGLMQIGHFIKQVAHQEIEIETDDRDNLLCGLAIAVETMGRVVAYDSTLGEVAELYGEGAPAAVEVHGTDHDPDGCG